MDKNQEYYINRNNYKEICIPVINKNNFNYLIKDNFLSEFSTDKEKLQVLENLGITQKLNLLQLNIDILLNHINYIPDTVTLDLALINDEIFSILETINRINRDLGQYDGSMNFSSIQNRVDEIEEITNGINESLNTIRQQINNVEYSVVSETNRAQQEENSLSQRINNEKSSLSLKVNNINYSITLETNRAQGEERLIRERLDSIESDINALQEGEAIKGRLDNIESDLDSETLRAQEKENLLSNRITLLELNPVILGNFIKHIFLTQEEYDALSNYERDTLYIIIERENLNGSSFGDVFPLILG